MMHIQGAAADKPRRQLHSKNKRWVAGQSDVKNGHTSDGERWERGGYHRRGRGRGGHQHHGAHLSLPTDMHDEGTSATEDEGASGESAHEDEAEQAQPEPETAEEREKFYQELVKQRELERKRAIAEGKMDDPAVPKRLDEAITIIGTCMDMCPKFERYRRERENNLDKWEVIPGTKRVDHKRAVKIYERAAGDKIIPSDLRPPPVLKRTLDYLFHDLVVREGFSQTYDFIRDRSRAVRNDFTMQHETGSLAMECHDRCARFHILALHLERDSPRFSIPLEEQQLMNTLQSLKEFYEDQRGRYQSPTELEMRVYHRLIHIRDQKERHEDIPNDIRNHPVFRLTTDFRLRVQEKSAPISKSSKLIVDDQAMQIFGQLAAVLREQNNVVMIYLVACIMERLFGKDCIEDIESIRGELTIPEIIDGISKPLPIGAPIADGEGFLVSPATVTEDMTEIEEDLTPEAVSAPAPLTSNATEWLANNFSAPSTTTEPSEGVFVHGSLHPSTSTGTSAFAHLASRPNSFGSGSAFGSSASAPSGSAFGNLASKTGVFGGSTFGQMPSSSASSVPGSTPKTVFGSSSVFGQSANTSSPFASTSAQAAAGSTRTSLSAQSTWPSAPSVFGSMSSAPTTQPTASTSTASPRSDATPPKAPSSNPFAPTFIPPQVSLTGTSVSASQPAVKKTSPGEKRSIFSPNPSTELPAIPPGPSSKPPAPPPSEDVFSVPLVAPQPADPAKAQAHQESTPERTPLLEKTLIERRQTLWDLPGSSSPFSRLKEDRMTFTPQPGVDIEPRTPISPTAPPPGLGRVPTISLPPTPTQRWFDPSSQSSESDIALSRKRSLLHFPSLNMPTPAPSEILSPIHITTPTHGKNAPAANGGPSPLYQSHVISAQAELQSASSSASTSVSGPVAVPSPSPKQVSAQKWSY